MKNYISAIGDYLRNNPLIDKAVDYLLGRTYSTSEIKEAKMPEDLSQAKYAAEKNTLEAKVEEEKKPRIIQKRKKWESDEKKVGIQIGDGRMFYF